MQDIDILFMNREETFIKFLGDAVIVEAHNPIGQTVDTGHQLRWVPFFVGFMVLLLLH